MNKENNKYQFKGWDWTELGYAWNILNKEMDDEESETIITDYMNKIVSEAMETPDDSVQNIKLMLMVKDIREFLEVLSSYKTYEAPVWKGILQVKSDYMLVRFTVVNLRNMWT